MRLKLSLILCLHFYITLTCGYTHKLFRNKYVISNNAVEIENAQKLLNDNNLELNLTFIKANYGNLAKYITTLETSGLSLADAINIIAQVQNEIGTDHSSIGKSIKKKLEVVIEKNSGFKTMKHISNILEGKATSRNNTIPEELTADDMAHLKFAPMTSVDVERSLSRYKTTLADNRRRFLFENIKQHLIIQCYETKGKKNEEEDGQEDN